MGTRRRPYGTFWGRFSPMRICSRQWHSKLYGLRACTFITPCLSSSRPRTRTPRAIRSETLKLSWRMLLWKLTGNSSRSPRMSARELRQEKSSGLRKHDAKASLPSVSSSRCHRRSRLGRATAGADAAVWTGLVGLPGQIRQTRAQASGGKSRPCGSTTSARAISPVKGPQVDGDARPVPQRAAWPASATAKRVRGRSTVRAIAGAPRTGKARE